MPPPVEKAEEKVTVPPCFRTPALTLTLPTGWVAGGLPSDPGARAAAVSNRSFFLLTLIYSLTRILDLAKDVST
jgi:hypothetical protein